MMANYRCPFRTIVAAFACTLMFSVWAIAGIDVRLPQELNLLEQGVSKPHFPWAKYRVAVFSFEDPHGTGLGDAIANILAKRMLFDSTVSSIGVVNFQSGLSPTKEDSSSYFDKVEKLIQDQGFLISLWGRVLPLENELSIDAFVQLSDEATVKRFSWRLELPEAMGGGALVARLRPNRIRAQNLRTPKDEAVRLRNTSRNIQGLRRSPTVAAPIEASIRPDTVYVLKERQNSWVRVQLKGGASGWTSVGAQCLNYCARLLEVADFASGLLKYAERGELNDATDYLSAEALAVEEQIKALDSLNLRNIEDIQKRSLGRALRWVGPDRWTGPDKWTKIDRGSGPAPGGSAFTNVAIMARTAMALQKAYKRAVAHPLPWPIIRKRVCTSNFSNLCRVLERFTNNSTFSGHLRTEEMADVAINAGIRPKEIQKFIRGELAKAIFNSISINRDTVTQYATELARASLHDPNNIDILKNLAVFFRFLEDRRRYQLAESIVEELKRKQP
jgi:hypothetical protein